MLDSLKPSSELKMSVGGYNGKLQPAIQVQYTKPVQKTGKVQLTIGAKVLNSSDKLEF
jgi:hypothetical protein